MRPLHQASPAAQVRESWASAPSRAPGLELALRLVPAAHVGDDGGVAALREPDAPGDEAVARRLVRRPLVDGRVRAGGAREVDVGGERDAVPHRHPLVVQQPNLADVHPTSAGRLRVIGLPGEVARRRVALAVILERRLDLGADLLRDRAARAEAAAGRRVDRARHVALEHDPLRLATRGIGHRDRRQERHACTGGAAARRDRSDVASSTILPRYMTATRSEMCRRRRGRAR